MPKEFIPKKRTHPTLCTCGSGKHWYALYDTKGNFVTYCCHDCEKTRRADANLKQLQQWKKKGD